MCAFHHKPWKHTMWLYSGTPIIRTTLGPGPSVLINGVSSFQGLASPHYYITCRNIKSQYKVLTVYVILLLRFSCSISYTNFCPALRNSGVSVFQGLKCTAYNENAISTWTKRPLKQGVRISEVRNSGVPLFNINGTTELKYTVLIYFNSPDAFFLLAWVADRSLGPLDVSWLGSIAVEW